jgi:16S rRNA (cytidine1402-2'-O)-methyltransferase
MQPGLYIVGTPIGNLEDITPRALQALRDVEAILAEDTRHTAKLLQRYEIRKPMVSYHKFNEAARVDQVLERIRAGAALALVTDSGMPAVSDPGARIVEACRRGGLFVSVLPGPSAVTSAVALSGFSGAGFVFGGFLPHKAGARRRRLVELLATGMPVVLFESPYRILKLLGEVEAVAGDVRVYVGRELTKHFEESLWGTAAEIRARLEGRAIKGEFVVVLDGRSANVDMAPGDQEADVSDADAS